MAVLSRDEFFQKLHERMPNANADEDISFLEDMTDTYNDLENRVTNSNVDWERKYKENDAAWREKYKHRFFHGGDRSIPKREEEEDKYSSENITFEDLFS